MTLVTRSICEPLRAGLNQEQLWGDTERGLIASWEIGRRLAASDPELAQRCLSGHLPPLYWKGGVSRQLKKKEKYGSLFYLAAWQGLRGQDLAVDAAKEHPMTCSATGMLIVYTPDISKLANETGDN